MDHVIKLEPYWDKIVDYYWATLDPTNDGSIWEFLEREYRARRSYVHRRSSTSTVRLPVTKDSLLRFEREADLTLFLLRWS